MTNTPDAAVDTLTAEARLKAWLLMPGSHVILPRAVAVRLLAELAGERAVARMTSAEVSAAVGPKLVADLQAKANVALVQIADARAAADDALRAARVTLRQSIAIAPLAFVCGWSMAASCGWFG